MFEVEWPASDETDSKEYLKARVPGVTIRGGRVSAYRNHAWLVDKVLRKEMHLPYTAVKSVDEIIYSASDFDAVTGPKGLKPDIWPSFMLPHQKNAVKFAFSRPGAFFNHPAGSGKSLTAIAWALCHPGKCLWITRAISKAPHAEQIARYSDATSQILSGDGLSLLRLKCYLRHHRLAKGADVRLDNLKIGTTDAQGEYILSLRHFENALRSKFTYGRHILSVYHPDAPAVASLDIDLQQNTYGDLTVDFNVDVEGNPPASVEGEVRPHIDSSARFVIINWEVLSSWYKVLCASEFSSVVFDESKYAKQAKRFTATHIESGEKPKYVGAENTSFAAMEISRARSIVRRLAMDATPLKDRPRDFWAQLDIIEPHAWGSRINFMSRYASRHIGTYGQVDDSGASNLDELKLRLSFVQHVVSEKETHAALPPLRRETVYIPASELVDLSERKALVAKAGGSPLERAIFEAAARKRKYVVESILEGAENKQNITVFTGRREDAEDLYKKVESKAKKHGVLTLLAHGGFSVQEREAIRNAYMNASAGAILIATGNSMGEAVDLQRTDLAFMAQLPYTPAELNQWEHRFFRLGGDRPVIIRYLIASGTVDEKIANMLLSKLPAVEKLVSADASDMTRAIMGGKSDDEIRSELTSFLLGVS